MVARMPAEDRQHRRKGAARLCGGNADGMAAVYQPLAVGSDRGVVVDGSQVQGQARKLSCAADEVARHTSPLALPQRREGGARRLAECGEIPVADRLGEIVSARVSVTWRQATDGLRLNGSPRRQKGAAMEV